MIVFIVGLYRSGTSLITSMVEDMGVPTCVEEFRREVSVTGVDHVYNILESYEVNMLNNEILKSTGQDEIYFDTDKMPKNIDDGFINRIKAVYDRVGYDCVIKDPRFIGVLKYWIDALDGREYKIIYVHRDNTDDIMKSFKKDKWFIGKVKGNYIDEISNLHLNLRKVIDYGFDGLHINFDFIRKYKNETYMLLYNFISDKLDSFNVKKIYFSEYYYNPLDLKKLFSRQAPSSQSLGHI